MRDQDDVLRSGGVEVAVQALQETADAVEHVGACDHGGALAHRDAPPGGGGALTRLASRNTCRSVR